MALDVGLILKLAPLAAQPLQRYRRSNLSKSLDRRVRSELECDPALSPVVTDSLLNEWFYIHSDPRGAVVIAGLLLHGDVAYFKALRHLAALIVPDPAAAARLGELLEARPVPAGMDERRVRRLLAGRRADNV